MVLSPSTLTLVRFHVGIDHLSSTEPRRSGEIPIFYPRSGLRCQLDGFVPVWDLYEFRLPTIFTRTVVRARHRVIMMLLHAATCTVTRDDMPGGLLDMSFLAGGMDMHACTVESATTSTQHPSPTPSVPSRSLASFQIAVFAPEGGTLSAEFLEFGF